MNNYTNYIFKHKRILSILLVLINIIAIIGIFKIKINTDFSLFSPKDSIYQERLDEVDSIFGELNQLIVIVELSEINDSSLIDLTNIQEDMNSIENIKYIQGIAPKTLLINNAQIPFSSLNSEEVLAYYKQYEDFSPITIKNDSYYITYTIYIDDTFSNDNISHIENILSSYEYSSYISGDLYNQLKISDYIISILLILPPLALLIILLVFRWQMGAIKPTLLSVLPAGIGTLWTFGLIGWLGNEVSILTAIVPIFIIVIGSADGLHFMSHYQELQQEGKDKISSINDTLKIVGIPMIVTTLTSMAGFMALLTMNTDSIFDLAIYSTVGILLAGIATWYVLPLLLTNNINVIPKKQTKHKLDLSIYIKKLTGIPTLIIILVILTVSIFSYSQINNEFNMLMVYKDYTIVKQNSQKVSEVNGGSIPIYVTITLDQNVISTTSLNEVSILKESLIELDEVNKIVNPYDLMNIVYSINTNNNISNDNELNMVYSNISENENSVINSLVSTDKSVVRLLVFTDDSNNDTLQKIEDTVNEYDGNAEVTGVQFLMKDLNVNISKMQIQSIFLALSIVFLMLIITLKSIKIAFFSLLPIIITVMALYGFLGISSIPLNITTSIIFSITIGVGIDYAVHFSSVYKHYLKETNSNSLAIEKAYSKSSRPIITNALGISLGLSILMLSPLTIHFNVSILMWISMIVSVIITLTLLPLLFSISNNQKGVD